VLNHRGQREEGLFTFQQIKVVVNAKKHCAVGGHSLPARGYTSKDVAIIETTKTVHFCTLLRSRGGEGFANA
jgi:hypothetical protein